jgi:hypothetical protein
MLDITIICPYTHGQKILCTNGFHLNDPVSMDYHRLSAVQKEVYFMKKHVSPYANSQNGRKRL